MSKFSLKDVLDMFEKKNALKAVLKVAHETNANTQIGHTQ